MSQLNPNQETAFEKQRGIGQVEVRSGLAQVHVSRMQEPIHDQRLKVLHAVAAAGVSVDFLKLTPSGVSFVISEANCTQVEGSLDPLGVRYTIRKDRSVLLVHAVNMRDEEGLTARVVQQAIASGAIVDHISDMHDKMLIVSESRFAETLQNLFTGAQNGR